MFLEYIFYYKKLPEDKKKSIFSEKIYDKFETFKFWRYYPNEAFYLSLVKKFIESYK